MATLTVQERQTDPSFVAAEAGGDAFVNDGATELLVLNVGLSTQTVTVVAARKCSHGFLDDWTKDVDPGELMRVGPMLPGRFNDSAGLCSVTYTDVTGISVAAQRQR
jgi:hypothetical protein